MGGAISATSEVGKGSCFYLEVSMGPELGQPTRAVVQSSSELEGITVLLLESRADQRARIGAVLTTFGAKVVSTSLPAEAIRVIQLERVDLAIVDAQTSVKEAIDFVRFVRDLADETRSVPILGLIPDRGLSELDRWACKQSGIDDFLPAHLKDAQCICTVLSACSTRQQRSMHLGRPA